MLYHNEVHWPRRVRSQLPNGIKTVVYSNHAVHESKRDRYGHVQLPQSVDLSQAFIFEAEEFSGKIVKVVFRYPLNDGRDIVMAAIPDKSQLYIKTVWMNETTDNHKTLDKSRYYCPKKA